MKEKIQDENDAIENPPADRNKTELTLRVTEESAGWLRGIGAKAIETEVPVCQKWIADLSAIWTPTPTEAKRIKLFPFKPTPFFPPEDILPEPKQTLDDLNDENSEHNKWWTKVLSWQKEQPHSFEKAISELPYYITIIIEVKTSRADFLNDKKWKHKPQADLQILSYAKGIIKDDEIPDGWWGLEHGEKSLRVKKRYWPLHDITDTMRMYLIGSIAERQHNRTANAFWNALAKRRRV